MKKLLLILLASCSCSLPRLEDIGQVSDGGSCQVAVYPATCAEVADHVEEIREALPCNEHGGYWTCAVYRCDCEIHSVCKECVAK